jgi:hypothetical protein
MHRWLLPVLVALPLTAQARGGGGGGLGSIIIGVVVVGAIIAFTTNSAAKKKRGRNGRFISEKPRAAHTVKVAVRVHVDGEGDSTSKTRKEG